jgi:hypothetical protein
MANYKYCVAENWGKGFIEHDESSKINFVGYPANVWRLPINNKDANLWINKVAGTVKTHSEAQALVDADIDSEQTEWDNDNESGESLDDKTERLGPRPTDITLYE